MSPERFVKGQSDRSFDFPHLEFVVSVPFLSPRRIQHTVRTSVLTISDADRILFLVAIRYAI